MTRDDIIRMAEEAQIEAVHTGRQGVDAIDVLMSFANIVAASEREACAALCDAEARMHAHLDRNGRSRHLDDAAVAKTCAAAIRARG